MKNVKVMLTGILVLAVVGGALAFKAKSTYKLFTLDGQVCKFSTTVESDIDATPLINATYEATQDLSNRPKSFCENKSAKFTIE